MKSPDEPDLQVGGLYYQVSNHAARRMRQRGISRFAVLTVLMFGEHKPAPGAAMSVTFRRSNIPAGCESEYERYTGLELILLGNEVITIYRRRKRLAKRRSPGKPHWGKRHRP
jgi:hypothetical protein